jgi:tetratricopeptide (TPR) repeat protein
MSKSILRCSFVFVLLVGGTALQPVQAQQPPTAIDSVRQAYERLNYERAARRARRVLRNRPNYEPEQLSEVHVILGAVRFANGNQQAARKQFEQALSLQPGLELSTLRYSPKIIQLFQSVKESIGGEGEKEPPREPDQPGRAEARYLIREDLRPQAALRSAALPGAGQIYKGETAEGWALAVLWGSTLVSADFIDRFRARAKSDYLDAERGDTSDPYKEYDAWYKTAEGLRLAAAAIWVYGMADALIDQQQPTVASSRASGQWQFRSTVSGGPGLRLNVHF